MPVQIRSRLYSHPIYLQRNTSTATILQPFVSPELLHGSLGLFLRLPMIVDAGVVHHLRGCRKWFGPVDAHIVRCARTEVGDLHRLKQRGYSRMTSACVRADHRVSKSSTQALRINFSLGSIVSRARSEAYHRLIFDFE